MGDLGKLIVAKSFKKLPKLRKIAKSGKSSDTVWHQNETAKMLLHTKCLLFAAQEIRNSNFWVNLWLAFTSKAVWPEKNRQIFVSKKVNSRCKCVHFEKLPMTWFKQQTSGIRTNRPANRVFDKYLIQQIEVKNKSTWSLRGFNVANLSQYIFVQKHLFELVKQLKLLYSLCRKKLL